MDLSLYEVHCWCFNIPKVKRDETKKKGSYYSIIKSHSSDSVRHHHALSPVTVLYIQACILLTQQCSMFREIPHEMCLCHLQCSLCTVFLTCGCQVTDTAVRSFYENQMAAVNIIYKASIICPINLAGQETARVSNRTKFPQGKMWSSPSTVH